MSDTVAFIDVGTNSVHMIVVRFYEGSMGSTVYQEKESIRMGKSLYENGCLDAQTLEKSRLVFSKFAEIARSYGAEEIVAMATCAAREAPNRSELVEIAEQCGFTLHIIPGKEEARLTRLGVAGPFCPRRTLCIDIGGGSTEISLALGKEDLYLDSLNIGAIRMAFGSGIDQKGRVSADQYQALKRMVNSHCYHSAETIHKIGFEEVFGSSGTIEAVADACATLRGDGDASYVLHSEVRLLMRKMCSMTSEERSRIPKVSQSRADIVIGGGVVLDELMEVFGITRMKVCRTGLREGMKIDYLQKQGHSDFDMRASSVRSLAARCGCTGRHEDAVVRYATELYSELGKLGLIPESSEIKELIAGAARLHDIGKFISYEKHQVHSYTILKNSYLAGFDSDELDFMSLMVRFHHGGFPDKGHKLFAGLQSNRIDLILRCAMVLRIADILDRGRDDAITEISAEALNDNINLTLVSKVDVSMVQWKLATLSDDFQKVFARRFNVEILQL